MALTHSYVADIMRNLEDTVRASLAEDIGQGDVTSAATLPKGASAIMQITARQSMVMCGIVVCDEVFKQLGGNVNITHLVEEGARVAAGEALMELKGDAQLLLTGERTALNIMQRMSSVATLTARYVDAVKGTKAIILDTRKTMPGMRALDKYAVTKGGGQNHRMRLDDMVLIKDNHIAVCGGVAKSIEKARAHTDLPVEVECDTLEQVKEAIAAAPDRIMLDNMTTDMLAEAVRLADGRVKLEASGGVNLKTVQAIAQTGVDYISVGSITHSVPAVDIGADIILEG